MTRADLSEKILDIKREPNLSTKRYAKPPLRSEKNP